MKHLLARTLFLFLSLSLFVAPVFAHAELLRSAPESNATLARAPVQVELFFSEALEPSFSSITVLDSNGQQVDAADSKVDPLDPTHLTVSLRSLPSGVYTVAWKALSAVDGHLTTGAFPFAVGDVDAAALAAAAQASRQIKLSLGEVIAKWLLYLSAAALTGGNLFILLVWQPAAESEVSDFERNREISHSIRAIWRTLAIISIFVLLIASVFGLLVHAGQASGAEIAAPWSNAVNVVLFNTRYGALWIARFALTLALAGALLEANTKRQRWIAFGLSLLLLLAISLGSHAAAEPQPIAPVAADWIHLLAASVWVGGLTHFVAAAWALRRSSEAPLLARLIPRFSVLALTSVGALALTGLYSAVLRVGSFEALNNTIYGRTLVVKLIIFLPMIALGAINLLAVTPAMQRAAGGPPGLAITDRFRRIITGEITLGALLLLSVGVLTALPPAQITATTPALAASAEVDDLRIALNITPGRVGVNTFTVRATSGGVPVDNADEVALRFTPSSANVPPSEGQLTAQGNGDYAIKGSFLSLPGTWQVQTVIRREGQFDSFANFNFAVGAAAQSYPWNRIGGGLLLLAALAYVFAFSDLGRTQAQLIGFGLVPAFALALASVSVFYRPPVAAIAGVVNPVPPNIESVAAGKQLYELNCVPCHGVAGKGDGPVGLTLNPRPADLTLHAVPGVHTDGQLYEWITNGFPGSVMPAFKQSLSDTERWHLVNTIRTLAPK